ncbi:MAG: serine protein kinase PrkA [Bradymonadia bacterium]
MTKTHDDAPDQGGASTGALDSTSLLAQAVEHTRARFEQEKSLLSFDDYLAMVARDPVPQTRDTARYIRDCFLFYGTDEISRPYGQFTRYRLFDCPFDNGRDPLIGQEGVQQQVFGLLSDFVNDGRAQKLILLHGPNGSAKSSFVRCLMRALEHYSQQPEGALYTFNWVFPTNKVSKGGIGFSGGSAGPDLATYANLGELEIDARLTNELRDHPLLLLPKAERRVLLDALYANTGARPPLSLYDGELSPKARTIFQALLKAYHGDLSEVLKHVQVERFYVSRRYRTGAVTVNPQLRVDASMRQLTADRNLASLPPSLQNLSLFEAMGDLVDANRGMIEFNDLLKRSPEAFKYLLSTCEDGRVSLDLMTFQMDAVFIGSTNEKYLNAFKETPDFSSFKARIELIQVPYLRDYTLEARIYADQVDPERIDRPVAPHTDQVMALWAVLTRLQPPAGVDLPKNVQDVVQKLTPLQKARLYASGFMPSGLPRDVSNALRSGTPSLYRETLNHPFYEGRFGASPRELRAALLSASRRSGYRSLTPMAVFEELEALCTQTSVYEFLRLESEREYRAPKEAIATVRQWYLSTVEDELHGAMGLVDSVRTLELFAQYIDHVTHYLRKEKRLDPVTGNYQDPDEKLMSDVESRIGVKGNADDARAGVLHRIAAWRMDNPDAPLDYQIIFSNEIGKITDAFYAEKREVADRIKRNLLKYLVEESHGLNADEVAQVEHTLKSLEEDYGYARPCAIDVVGFVLKHGLVNQTRDQ